MGARKLRAVTSCQRPIFSIDAERQRLRELRLHPADHRHTLGRRHGKRHGNTVGVEIVGEGGHPETAKPVIPCLGFRAWRNLRLI